jgi:hypothetical protein
VEVAARPRGRIVPTGDGIGSARIAGGRAALHRNIIVRLVAYYLGVTAVMTGLFYTFPVLRQYVAAERARQGMRA